MALENKKFRGPGEWKKLALWSLITLGEGVITMSKLLSPELGGLLFIVLSVVTFRQFWSAVSNDQL